MAYRTSREDDLSSFVNSELEYEDNSIELTGDALRELFLTPSLATHDEGGALPVSTRVPSWIVAVMDQLSQAPGNPWGSRGVIIRTLLISGLKVLSELGIKPGTIIDEALFREAVMSRRIKENHTISRARGNVREVEEGVQDFMSIDSEPKAIQMVKDFLGGLASLSDKTREDYIHIVKDSRTLNGFVRASKDKELVEMWAGTIVTVAVKD